MRLIYIKIDGSGQKVYYIKRKFKNIRQVVKILS